MYVQNTRLQSAVFAWQFHKQRKVDFLERTFLEQIFLSTYILTEEQELLYVVKEVRSLHRLKVKEECRE